jgi:hypothetical protein
MIQGNGTKQDYVSGAHAKRDLVGAYIRYFYNRTYGVQASWAHDFHYTYTSPTGLEYDFGKNNAKNIALLWNPAMNVSFHLNYNPNSDSRVFNRATQTPVTSSSYSFGVEYSF